MNPCAFWNGTRLRICQNMRPECNSRYGGILLRGRSDKTLGHQAQAHPYQNKYALVGGFVDKNEDAYQACIREVKEVGLEIPLERWNN